MSNTKKSMSSGNVWTIMIGLALAIWGLVCIIVYYYTGTDIAGSPWLLLAGGIMIIAAISSIATYRYNREKVLGALKSYPRISLAELSKELKMNEREVKAIIIDLRTDGQLKASFDTESGDVIILEVKGQPLVVPVSSSGLPEHEDAISPYPKEYREQGFCQYCGTLTKPEDMFCNNCGSALK